MPDRPFAHVRRAVRAVVTDESGGIYLMHAANHGYYKLPSGGVDPGEELLTALSREIREEMGGRVEVLGEVGQTIQFDQTESFRQDSYCYRARLVGELGEPDLTESEQAEGFRVERFADLTAAIQAVQQGMHNPIHTSITLRDAALLMASASQ